MSETPTTPPTSPVVEPTPPPVAPPVEPKAEPENNLLNILEKDFIDSLKDKINLEDFADLSQEARIKSFRALQKQFAKQATPEKKPDEKPPLQKGLPIDPTKPPADAPDSFKTNLQKNNLREYNADIRSKSSVHNITDRIRGKNTKK